MLKIINQNKKYLMFIGIILLAGLFMGIIYYFFISNDTKEIISNTLINYNNYRYNAIFKDLIIMSLLLVTSIFVIGIPCSLFYVFYEGFSIGFLSSVFFINFSFSGLIYILLYFIVNKLFVLLLMTFFIKKIINISRCIVRLIVYKKDNCIKMNLVNTFCSSIYLIISVLIINIILYLITPYIFSTVSFLIK